MKKITLSFFSMLLAGSLSLQAQISENIELLYNDYDTTLPSNNGDAYNDIWGFVQADREYAVIGSTLGAHIYDVTDPDTASELFLVEGKFTGPFVVHRDYHEYNGYIYAVCDEGPSSLQIIDIKNLPTSVDVVYDSNEHITRAHNVFIDEENARLYAISVKASDGNTPVKVFSLEDPENPVLIGALYNNLVGGAHDAFVRDNIMYFHAESEGMYIIDFTDPTAPEIIGSLADYPDKGYNHSGWLSNDGNTYVFSDEDAGFDLKICDVSDPSEIEVLETFDSEITANAIPHNHIIKNNFLYTSYYEDGLQIYDISDPENPERIAYYDTYPDPSIGYYNGAWGVYPFLPSGNILVSDIQYGLYVLKHNVAQVSADGPDWTYSNTGANHIILLPPASVTVNEVEIDAGDYVGVFYEVDGNLECGGFTIWETGTENQSITAWGAESSAQNGFQNGENFQWIVWDAETGEEIVMTPVYDETFSHQGAYSTDGTSGLISLTYNNINVDELEVLSPIDIFPNPATEFITVRADQEVFGNDMNVIIYNVEGQMVATYHLSQANTNSLDIHLDHYSSGIYTCKVIGEKKEHTEQFIVH